MEFGFKKLEVWKKAVTFANHCIDLGKEVSLTQAHYSIINQLERASTSVSLNIAEGKGRGSQKEFVRFLYIARGSLYETITIIEILYQQERMSKIRYDELNTLAFEIASMIKGLINALYQKENNSENL